MKDLLKIILFFSLPFIGCYLVAFLETLAIPVPVLIGVFIGIIAKILFKVCEGE